MVKRSWEEHSELLCEPSNSNYDVVTKPSWRGSESSPLPIRSCQLLVEPPSLCIRVWKQSDHRKRTLSTSQHSRRGPLPSITSRVGKTTPANTKNAWCADNFTRERDVTAFLLFFFYNSCLLFPRLHYKFDLNEYWISEGAIKNVVSRLHPDYNVQGLLYVFSRGVKILASEYSERGTPVLPVYLNPFKSPWLRGWTISISVTLHSILNNIQQL